MKQKLLSLTRLRSLLLLACVMLGVSALGADVTFSYTAYSGQGTSGSGSACSATQNVISIASTKGYYASGEHVREYQGSDITISGATITKIEITCTASGNSNYGPSKLGLPTNSVGNYSYSGAVGTWTGSATSVILHANAQVRWTQIKVTYTPNAGPTYTVTLGDDNTTLTELGYGAGVSLPTRDDQGVFKFQGWSVSNLNSETTEAPTNILTGHYNPNANITLYPIYKRIDSTGGPGITASVSISNYAASNSWTNGTKYETLIIDDNLTASVSGGSNTGKYYSSDNSWRVYGSESGTLTITSTEGELNSVTFTYNNNTFKYGDIPLTSEEAVNLSGTSATFTAYGSAIQITSISVVYGSGTTTYYTSNPIIPVHSAHFFVNGVEASSDDFAEGANIVFPEAPEDINGKNFMGWTTAAINSPTNTEPTLVTSATMGEEDVNYYAVFATRTAGTEQNVSMTINSGTQNIPTSYADSRDYTLNGIVFNITQMYKTGATLQWRAAGNTNGTGTMYNKDAIHNIQRIVITYTDTDTNKNFTVKVGSSENPTNGTSIIASTEGNVSTFDCSNSNCDYFVLTNGTNAGYLSSIVIYYTQMGPDTYSDYCTTVKTAPEFTYATASYTVGYGASFETPVLTKPNDLDATQISYSISQNEGVATINATTGAVTIGNNAGTVTVTATFAGDNRYLPATASYTITVEPKVTITMNADGIRTYASLYGLDFSQVEGLTAYYATGYDKTNLSLTMTAMDVTAPGAGMMLKGAANQTYTVPVATSGSTTTTQYLVGLTEATNVPQVDAEGNTTFILAKVNDVINWYKLREENYTLKANSAYLRLPADAIPQGQNPVVMDFTGGSNGISTATVTAINNESWYTLDGRLLQSKPSTKGIYVNNGRKIVIK